MEISSRKKKIIAGRKNWISQVFDIGNGRFSFSRVKVQGRKWHFIIAGFDETHSSRKLKEVGGETEYGLSSLVTTIMTNPIISITR